MFSVADAMLLRPLPVARPDELLAIGFKSEKATRVEQGRASYLDYFQRSKCVHPRGPSCASPRRRVSDHRSRPACRLRFLVGVRHFPSTRARDRARFQPAAGIRERMQEAGFVSATTGLAQHLPLELPVDEAKQRGLLDRASNSQLLLLTDAEYDAGLRRITGEQPVLRGCSRRRVCLGRRLADRDYNFSTGGLSHDARRRP